MTAFRNFTTPQLELNTLARIPEVPALDNTFGAALLGTFVGLILYGICLHQSYRYFSSFPGDPKILKYLVILVMSLETVSAATSMHICYHYLVTNFLNPIGLLRGIWSIKVFSLLSGLVMCASQSFFIRRVYLFGKQYRIFVVAAIVMCVLELGFFTAATTKAIVLSTFEEFEHFEWLVSSGSCMAVSADVVLTSVLIYALLRSRTGVRRTDTMLDLLIMYTINTGLLTSLFNCLSLAFGFALPWNLIYFGVAIPGPPMYGNTLLAALNSRKTLSSRSSEHMLDTSPFGFSIHPKSEPTIESPNIIPNSQRLRRPTNRSTTAAATTDSKLVILHITETNS